MPTIFSHAVVGGALAAKAAKKTAKGRWKLVLACAFCALLPDADYFGYQQGVQYSSLFGHRGFTHSFFFAALCGLLGAWWLNRKEKEKNLARDFLFVFLATASHPILDALTDGGEGVAFFSPFTNHRYFFPWRPIMVSPLGVGSFLSLRGLLVLANEFLLVLVPLAIALVAPGLWKKTKVKKVFFLTGVAAWIGTLSAISGLTPLENLSMTYSPGATTPVIDLYVKQYWNSKVLNLIPTGGLKDGKLVKSFQAFQNLGLFNRRLEAERADEHWASGFFPNWFGGIGGRWQDPNLRLMLRTVFGYGPPNNLEIQSVLKDSVQDPSKQGFLFRLSPTEKYDLALSDYNFSSTKSILAITHNAKDLPQYWYGICNGMAAASKWYEEPFRAVDVINPNGFRVRFHPNDVKALLGYAMANVSTWSEIGTRCSINGPEARGCRVNAGAFFLATMNRIGLARDGFIVDGFSGTRKQFYLFDAVRLEVLQPPTSVEKLKEWTLPTPVKSLTKVRFTMDFVSTILGDKDGGGGELPGEAPGTYKKVGRVVVPRVLEAMLALNAEGEVIGGAWLGDEDVPDVIFFPSYLPSVDNNERLKVNPNFYWPAIQRIYKASILPGNEHPLVDFSE